MTNTQKTEAVLVHVKHLTKQFDVSEPWLTRLVNHSPKMTLTAVDDVSFDIYRGEILSLVGESGCGKAQRLNCCAVSMNRLLAPLPLTALILPRFTTKKKVLSQKVSDDASI